MSQRAVNQRVHVTGRKLGNPERDVRSQKGDGGMKKTLMTGIALVGIITICGAQEVTVGSIDRNGSMSFFGAENGSTATVEWAASLTDAGRTNWHGLTNVIVSSDTMTTDIPMFFRVRGKPVTSCPYFPLALSNQWTSLLSGLKPL